jgi:hypothetical protein
MARTDTLTVECLPDKLIGNRRKTVQELREHSSRPADGRGRAHRHRRDAQHDRRRPPEDRRILGISYKTLYNKTKKYKSAGGEDEDEE